MTKSVQIHFKFSLVFFIFPFCLSVVFAQPVLLTDKNFPNEPAVAVNHKNPKQILVGAAVGQVFLSMNSGKTFTQIPLDDEYGLWSDPSVFFDNDGNAYYFHLSGTKKGNSSDRIVCQLKRKNDQLFRVHNTIGKHPTACLERPVAVFNPFKNHIYLTYVIFDAYGSTDPKDSTRLFFTWSDDGGETWDTPVRLNAIAGDCSDRDSSVQGATTTFDKDGNIAVVWGSNQKIWINTYSYKTKQWLKHENIVANQPEGWDYNIPKLKMPNGLPVVINYIQNKKNKLFVFWTQYNAEKDNSLIYYSYSTDWGTTWTEPVPLIDPQSKVYQFHVWASQHKNNLVVSCYEQLLNGETYIRLFINNGYDNKFNSVKVEESVFYSDSEQYVGDMNQITIFNKTIFLPFIKAEKGNNQLYFIQKYLK